MSGSCVTRHRRRKRVPELYFYHTDHLGTSITMTDTDGELVWKMEHHPFGDVASLPVSTIENNLRFPGQYYDAESGLHHTSGTTTRGLGGIGSRIRLGS
jgi:uncharacterized protein RhaS with RHS repeats